VIEARRGSAIAWRAEIGGTGGPLTRTQDVVAAVTGGTEVAFGRGSFAMRGEPGAAVIGIDAKTGAIRWGLAFDATEWAVISTIAPTDDGAVIGGSFSGTLRADAPSGPRTVSSGGKSDGFVARIAATGQLAWLVRIGGPGVDAVQGVAAKGDRVAVAGTFAAGADLLGQPLEARDDKSPLGDVFVGELDGHGARRWATSFGGPEDDAAAGVAIDELGNVVVAATVRGSLHVGGADLAARGTADGVVAWWSDSGAPGAAVLVGGLDFDGLRGIVAAGDRVVVSGFFSGKIRLGERALSAGGGDDAFIAELDATGRIVESWPVSGDGREEVVQLAPLPGGFIAGVTHTAGAQIDSAPLAMPKDPMAGAAIAIRPD
jgi:hypothetical protein